MTKFLRSFLIIGLGITSVVAADPVDPINKQGKIAIKGYDPVAYFTQHAPVKGSPIYTWDWLGATWQFSSAADRDEFAKSPEKYAPQYGGYCAYGVSQGHAVPIDPEAWSIIEGKLYLNYSKSVQKTWSSDIPGYVDKANRNWPALHR